MKKCENILYYLWYKTRQNRIHVVRYIFLFVRSVYYSQTAKILLSIPTLRNLCLT